MSYNLSISVYIFIDRNSPVAQTADMPIQFKPLPSREILRERFCYEPNTGILSLRHRTPGYSAGTVVGSLTQSGYLMTRIFRNPFYISRVVWMWVTGEDPGELQVDHINGIRDDNRWSNLRLATSAENSHNKHNHTNSLSGIPGAQWVPETCVWVVHVYHLKKQSYFGTFTDPDRVITTLRDFHRRTRGELFNENKWLAHIEKSRRWIEACRDLAECNLKMRSNAREAAKVVAREKEATDRLARQDAKWRRRAERRGVLSSMIETGHRQIDLDFAELVASLGLRGKIPIHHLDEPEPEFS